MMTARRIEIVSILIICMAVNIYVPTAPSILGALVDYQNLPLDVAGRLISFNFFGATTAAVAAIFFLHRPGFNLRLAIFGCLLAVILTSVGSVLLADSIPALIAMRFVSGLGAGLGFTVSSVALVGTPNVARSYSILYGTPFLIGGIAMAGLPHVYAALGVEGTFYGMGALNLAVCALLRYFPKTINQENMPERAVTPPSSKHGQWLAALMLAALFLHYVCNSGIWTYFERLGVAAGMTPVKVGAILGPSTAAAIAGMAGASLLGGRIGYLQPIYLGIVTITVSTLALLLASSELVFAASTAIFNASITFVTPYFIAILALLVPSGRGVTIANVATIVGFSTGPLAVSFLLGGNDFQLPILLTAAGFILAGTLVFVFSRTLQSDDPAMLRRNSCGRFHSRSCA